MKQALWKTALMAMVCGLILATAAAAQDEVPEEIAISDPLTVKVGEDVRIAIFNPNDVPVNIRAFAHNPVEGTTDESEDIVIAAGNLRFFDMKVVKEFIGIGGFRMSPTSERDAGCGTDPGPGGDVGDRVLGAA